MDMLIAQGEISSRILTLRREQVMIDSDLAELYGVTTKRLNEQVKRNIERFPDDFMFQLNENEKKEVVAKCDHLNMIKFSHVNPYVFTEQGLYMLASVLRSLKAIEVNIFIIRTFKKLREFSKHYNVFHRDIPCGYLQYMYKKNNHTINGNHKGLPLHRRELSMMGFIR